MEYHIPIQNQQSYRSIPRNKDLRLSIENHCDFPSRTLAVDSQGYCFVCACEAWLPITVGRIQDFSHLSEIWDTPVARSLQSDIDHGLFTHCAVDRCGIIDRDQRAADYCGKSQAGSDTYYISVNIDESCNLSCPSCRGQPVMITSGEMFDHKHSMVQHLVDLLTNFEPDAHIIMSGNGDPLASAIMRPLLHNWQARPNHSIRLFTNGLLMRKQLDHNSIVHNITQYFISTDAGSASVYEQVRRPGNFAVLLENLDWLATTVQRTGAHVLLKFVLQDANFEDMENFVTLCETYGFAGVINRLEDWGTWVDFAGQDVIGNQAHPNHDRAMQCLRDVYQRHHHRMQFNSSLERLARG